MNTGMVRRIDDLGQIVIPNELLKTLQLAEDNPLNIAINHKEITIKSYTPLKEYKIMIKTMAKILKETKDIEIIVCDKAHIIYKGNTDLVEGMAIEDAILLHTKEGIAYSSNNPKAGIPFHDESKIKIAGIIPIKKKQEIFGSICVIQQGRILSKSQLSNLRFMADFLAHLIYQNT